MFFVLEKLGVSTLFISKWNEYIRREINSVKITTFD